MITSYQIVASEFAAYAGEAKDEAKSNKSKKTQQDSDSDAGSDDSVDFRKHLQKNKITVSRASKKKDALFRLKYWRIVLGDFFAF